MIVSGHSCGFEFTRFHRTDFTQSNAHLHPELAHFTDNLQHALKFFGTVAQAAPGRAHAKPAGALRASAPGRGQNIFDRQQFFALDTRRIMSRLRAVSAVFTASASLDAE